MISTLAIKNLGNAAHTLHTLQKAKKSELGFEIHGIAIQEAQQRFYEVATPEMILEVLALVKSGETPSY